MAYAAAPDGPGPSERRSSSRPESVLHSDATMRKFPLCSLLFLIALALPPAGQAAPPDASFRLTAHFSQLANYFPTYLANGYVSTFSSPRGAEPDYSYMVALMDYTRGDISRPAAVPGWSEIDYNPGGAWLNATPLNRRFFSGYSQTLDMRDGTLATRYRFDYGPRSTDVEVVTFVSQADPHLAATRIVLTPHFDGTVRLRFPVRLWSDHQPRFPIARMSGHQMRDAVIASGQNLLDKPVPTADRAPIWYPGYIRATSRGVDLEDHTLWLDGRAVRGLHMAEAVALALPPGLVRTGESKQEGPYKLSINLTIRVHKGVHYTFTKYAALSRKGWGTNAASDRALARKARREGFDALLARHVAAWHRLWRSDIVVKGSPKVQRALHSDLYYLLSNTTEGTSWAMGACALTPNYAGHVFWDSDSWVFPALLLLHPERARSIVMFRSRTLPAARRQAEHAGYPGAMYPWESDPEKGTDVVPAFASGVRREIHLDADIAIAQWQYYLATGDKAWLKRYGWPVIHNLARFWTRRVTWNKVRRRYEILHVTSPDEAYDDVNNDSFTNAAARKALDIAIKAAAVVDARPDPRWREIAAKMYIPFDRKHQHHLDFDPSVPHDRITWMGSSVVWLMYPNLDLPMSHKVRRNDFRFQLRELKTHGDDPNEMMMVMMAVGAAELGDSEMAGAWIRRNIAGFLKPPFQVRTETVANNAGYILATSAGFVQSFVYGLTGLRIEHGGLVRVYPPVLPRSWQSVTLRNVAWHGQRFDIVIDRDAGGHVRLKGLPPGMDPP